MSIKKPTPDMKKQLIERTRERLARREADPKVRELRARIRRERKEEALRGARIRAVGQYLLDSVNSGRGISAMKSMDDLLEALDRYLTLRCDRELFGLD